MRNRSGHGESIVETMLFPIVLISALIDPWREQVGEDGQCDQRRRMRGQIELQ